MVRGTASGRVWKCRCICGNEIEKYTGQLRKVQNTGCRTCENLSRAAVHITHGETFGHSERQPHLYRIWKGIRRRCCYEKDISYKYYGAIGIKRCSEWDAFASFREWAVSHGYAEGLSIDRIDPYGNYEPSNCRWVTRSENSKGPRRASVA